MRGVLLILLLLPFAQAHPEDATEFNAVAPRVPITGNLDDGTVYGIELIDAPLLPGSLVTVSARNHGPGFAQFAVFEDRNESAVWQVPPRQGQTKAFVVEGGPLFFDVRGVIQDTLVEFFMDVADCTAPCAKEPVRQVPGATAFRVTGEGTVVARMDASLPITGWQVLDAAGSNMDSDAIGAGATFVLVEHGTLDQGAYRQLLSDGGTLQLELVIEPDEGSPFPFLLLILLLVLVSTLKRQ